VITRDAGPPPAGLAGSTDEASIEVDHLSVSYTRRRRVVPVVRDVSFQIGRGEAYGLVGESGCGKTTVAMAIMRYLPRNGIVESGTIRFDAEDLLEASAARLRELRGNRIAMVYQEVGSSLNPTMRVGAQVAEVYRHHAGLDKAAAKGAAIEMFSRVQLADPAGIADRFPHQLSGGQQQRVSIAMALATNPDVLVMDEPTTGLDATVEAEVLDLVQELRSAFGTAVLLISHNLGIVARICDRVGVLYAGQLVEEAPANEIFERPAHPYTLGLVRCVPRLDMRKHLRPLEPIAGALPAPGEIARGCSYVDRCPIAQDRCREDAPQLTSIREAHRARCYYHQEVATIPAVAPKPAPPRNASEGHALLTLSEVTKVYRSSGSRVEAVAGVSLEVARGEVLGIVGESGSGKSSLGKCIVGLVDASGGEIRFAERRVSPPARRRDAVIRRELQMVFQDPDSALNPQRSVRSVLERALRRIGRSSNLQRETRVMDLAAQVRLEPRHLPVKPGALSGGLKQRVAIAAAFAGAPQLVVCDEPVSALDVSVQASILNLLADLQATHAVSYVLISHDLGVVRYLSDRIAVMYLGQLVELGPSEAVFSPPHHPYTEALASAIPSLDRTEQRERIRLTGTVPSAAEPPGGCRFHTRCPRFLGDICRTVEPPWRRTEEGNAYRCHIAPDDLAAAQRERPEEQSRRPGSRASDGP
jgi:peptide/nickel transport system ATP-binding protein